MVNNYIGKWNIIAMEFWDKDFIWARTPVSRPRKPVQSVNQKGVQRNNKFTQ